MQLGIDVKFMHTNFGGCDLFGFVDTVQKVWWACGQCCIHELTCLCIRSKWLLVYMSILFKFNKKERYQQQENKTVAYIYIIRDDNDDSQK